MNLVARLILIVFAIIFTNCNVYADPQTETEATTNMENVAQRLSAGIDQIENLANLTSVEHKDLVFSFFQKYKNTLDYIVKTSGTAAEKRARVQEFIESIEKLAGTKTQQLRLALESVDIIELRRTVAESEGLTGFISKENAHTIITVINFLKLESSNAPEFEKRIHLLVSVLGDVVDIWGTDIYKALSTDKNERIEGRAGLINDFYYFKNEYQAIFGIVKIMMDSNTFQNMKPQQMSDLAEYIQKLGLVYIKFAQTASNVAIPLMKAQAKLAKAENANVLALQKTIDKLKEFQDGLPPISPEYAESVIKKDIETSSGKKKLFLEQILKNIDFNKPLKSGTIGTTYQVRIPVTTNRLFIKSTHDEYYIVKIPRPGLKEEIEHGQKLFKSIFVLSTALFPNWLQWVPRFLGSCFDSVSSTFQDETKPLKEAAKMRKFKMLLMLSSVKVPAVKYASEGLLVMDAVTENENFEAYIDREMDEKYIKFLEQITAIENQTFSYDSKKQDEAKEQALEKLYADNPVDKRKMDTFAKLYGEFLESTVYMALAMKQLHADLHPGNILVKADKGSYSLHLVDWGNTVNVDGMIMDPLFLVAYTALGNSKQIAHRLYNLRDTKSSVTEERIHEIVSSVLVENKLDAKGKTILRKALEYIQGLRQGYDFEASSQASVDSEEQAKTMGVLGSQIMMRLFKETDYIVSGKYIQLFRSALPAAATFIKISSALPKKVLIKESIKNAGMGFFMGSLKALILKNPAELRSLIAEINSGVEDKAETLERASVHDDKNKATTDKPITAKAMTGKTTTTKPTTDKSTKEKTSFLDSLIPSFAAGIKCEDLLN